MTSSKPIPQVNESSLPELDHIRSPRLPGFDHSNPSQAVQLTPSIPREVLRTSRSLSIPLKPIMIVGNDPNRRIHWSRVIQEEQYQTQDCSSESFLIFSQTKSAEISLLIVDTDHLPESMYDHADFFHRVYANTPVILVGDGFRSRRDRRDYPEYLIGYIKEFDATVILSLIYSALKLYRTVQEKEVLETSMGIPISRIPFFGTCPAIQRLEEEVRFAASQDGPVFLEAEPGTHLDITASQIHMRSSRCNEPFDIFPFTPGMSEFYDPLLFGLEKGTSPHHPGGWTGKLELLKRGTILIEKIDHLHFPAQERLLAFLKSKSLYRINAVKPIPCETRLLVSGSVYLKEWLAVDAFSAELFEAVSKVTVHIPSMRELVEAIPEWISLISYWMCEKIGKQAPRLTDAAVEKMMRHSWPGNTDEFVRILRHLIYTNQTGVVDADDIVFSSPSARMEPSLSEFVGLSQEELNRRFILETLRYHRGNRAATARVLEISEKTLAKKLKEFAICSNSNGHGLESG